MTVVIDRIELPFLGLAATKKTKRAAGRTKDLLDLVLLSELEEATRATAPPRVVKKSTKKAAAKKKR